MFTSHGTQDMYPTFPAAAMAFRAFEPRGDHGDFGDRSDHRRPGVRTFLGQNGAAQGDYCRVYPGGGA